MLWITLYQVWSRPLPLKENEPILHVTCAAWREAVQAKDKTLEQYYRRWQAALRYNNVEAASKDLPFVPEVKAHVWIKEVIAGVNEAHLSMA